MVIECYSCIQDSEIFKIFLQFSVQNLLNDVLKKSGSEYNVETNNWLTVQLIDINIIIIWDSHLWKFHY